MTSDFGSDQLKMSCGRETLVPQLPSEILLKILKMVDTFTLRQSVPLVNKKFFQLSKDFTLAKLYERYETADYDTDGIKTRAELRYEMYKKHLKVLVTNSWHIHQLQNCEFDSLEKLVIKDRPQLGKCLGLTELKTCH